jgi:hypothetical protein
MTVQPIGGPEPTGSHQVINLGGETAVPQNLGAAEAEAVLAAHDAWVAAGCPGELSHEEVMAQLCGRVR